MAFVTGTGEYMEDKCHHIIAVAVIGYLLSIVHGGVDGTRAAGIVGIAVTAQLYLQGDVVLAGGADSYGITEIDIDVHIISCESKIIVNIIWCLEVGTKDSGSDIHNVHRVSPYSHQARVI